LYSAVEDTSYAFVASRAQSWVLQDHILRDSRVCGMGFDFDNAFDSLRDTILTCNFTNFASKDIVPLKANMFWRVPILVKLFKTYKLILKLPSGKKVVFGCLKTTHARDFLLVIPIDGLGQHMSSFEYCTIFRYRLMMLLFPKDGVCPICRQACLDIFGSMQPIAGSFHASNIGTTWSDMCFLIF
jgi:hypothetical protein